MSFTNLSTEQLEAFNKDGYIIIKKFCSKPEVDRLYATAIDNFTIHAEVRDQHRNARKKAESSLWFTPNNDVFGYLARSEKVVNTMAQLLDSDAPVCHIQSKLMEKKSMIGGAWEWHQDHAYWRQNKFLKASQMVSLMLSITGTNKQSGCSQIIRGSHKLNGIKHGFEGGLVGADMVKVNEALRSMELVYVELSAGDAIFFHSNLLHRADANFTPDSRWSIISCYSSQSNLVNKAAFTSWNTPVRSVPNEAILEWEQQSLSKSDSKQPVVLPYN